MQDVNISKKKPFFPLNRQLIDYLGLYDREMSLPLKYSDLLNTHERLPLLDENGEDTLWQIMLYSTHEMEYLHKALTQIYVSVSPFPIFIDNRKWKYHFFVIVIILFVFFYVFFFLVILRFLPASGLHYIALFLKV